MNSLFVKRACAALLAVMLAASFTACRSEEASGSAPASSGVSAASGTDETGAPDSAGSDTSAAPDESGQEGGNSASSKDSGGKATSNKTKATSGSTKPAASFTKPKYDLKGRELVVWTGESAPKKGDIWYESWKEVEAEYHCKLKFTKVSYSVAVSKMTAAALSGKSECDIWNAQWYDTFPSFVAKGIASPLSDQYPFDKDPNWADSGNQNNYWNGKLYGLNTGAAGPGWGLWYNKAMLSAANLEDPAKLVEKGTWTWDTFRDMCVKLTKTAGGTTTPWGYYDEYLFVNLILTNGGEIIDVNSKDGPKFTMNSEATKYAMRYAIDLANKYKVVPSIGSVGDADLLELFPKGKVAFTTYNAGYGPVCVSKGMKASDLGYTYFPKGPNAKDYVVHAPTLDTVYVVPPQVKDKDAVTCVLQDYLCVWDSSEKFAVTKSDLLDIGFSNTEYKEIYKNNKSFMLNGGKKNKPSYINNFFIAETLNTELLYPLLKGELDVDSGIKKVAPVAQTKIDELVMQAVGH